MVSRRALLAGLGAAAVLPVSAKTSEIEIGVCGSADDFEKAERAGFDYYEPSAAATAVLSEEAFADFAKRVSKSRIKCDCFNGFIRTLTVTGTAVDNDALNKYMNGALDRCRTLGASIVVWGSASSRNIPDGFPRDRAWQQMVSFLRMAAPLAEARNIVIAIEPLRKQESNIINSGAEAFRLVREVGHSHVKMIIDYYHLSEEHEDPKILEEARDEIVHLHFANPKGRVWPKDPAEDPGYGAFFAMLKKTGFRGGLSIEGKGTFEADAAGSLAFFKKELA
jgi:D-psicose/D-tagatose/L-ribulose 3-epimerase